MDSDHRQQTDEYRTVVYVDFSKAFDTVSHARLITKLRGYGVDGDLLNIIDDF